MGGGRVSGLADGGLIDRVVKFNSRDDGFAYVQVGDPRESAQLYTGGIDMPVYAKAGESLQHIMNPLQAAKHPELVLMEGPRPADGYVAAGSGRWIPSRNILLAQINAEKNRRRDSGFVVDGVLWDSDYAARLAYAEMAARFAAAPDCTVHWKASAGSWVTLDNALFDRVRTAAETHIAAAYEWQRQQEESLASVPDDQLDGFAVT